jgi:hypothetical protein
MSRWKAAAIHFSVSLLVFLFLLTLILSLWYPGILFSIDGGWSGLRLVVGVDLVLGPLLTLIVFKSGKPGLKFDLACIVTAQVLCMAAGVWIVYSERPIALVLAYDTFYSVNKEEFLEYERDPNILAAFPGAYPKLIYVNLPESEKAADAAFLRAQYIGDPLYIQTENYRAIPENMENVKKIFRRESVVRGSVSEAMLGRLDDSCVLSKFISPVASGYVCFDRENRKLSQHYENEYLVAKTAQEERVEAE